MADNIGVGDWLGYSMVFGGLFSTMGTYNAYLHTASVALRALSEDGKAPAIFSAFPQYKPPVVAIFFYSVTTAVLVLLEFEELVEVETGLYCLHILMFTSSLTCLRWREPALDRPYKLPFGKVGAIVIPMCPMMVALLNIAFLPRIIQVAVASVAIFTVSTGVVLLWWKKQRIKV